MNSIIYYANNDKTINIDDNIKNKFTNTRLKKIVNVYQPNLLNGKPEGFGDYLRGCVSLSIICKIINIEFSMNIKNHPMSKYIYTDNHEDTNIDYNNIIGISDKLDNACLTTILDYINKYNGEVVYLYTNYIFHNSMIQKHFNFTNDIKKNIMQYINPTIELQNNIKLLLENHKLMINDFSIIHIRGGDDIINKNSNVNTYDKTYFLMSTIKYIKKHYIPNKTYLISDSIHIKKRISNIFKDIKYDNNESIHLSLNDGNQLNDSTDLIKYTMQDLYLLLYCNQITSITIYSHGSGFIKWLSILHNKQCIQYILNSKNSRLKIMLK